MVKSKIIKELSKSEINIEEALSRLLVISTSLQNKQLNNWIKCELNGYKSSEDLPGYRKMLGNLYYSGINGSYTVENQPLSKTFIDKEMWDSIDKIEINQCISQISDLSNDDSNAKVNLVEFSSMVAKNSNQVIQCTNVYLSLPKHGFKQIVSNVKTNILEILIRLESEFGNLDEMDIEVKSEEIKNEVNNNINAILGLSVNGGMM